MTPDCVLLFLDFDGVLHPFSPRSDRPAEESVPFAYLARLEAVLRDHPSVEIVVASDWRKHHTLEELRQFFSEDIRLRIAGVLDIDATDHQVGNRQRLVERYLAEQGLANANWLALDDDADNYRIDAPLIRCDDGFRDEEEKSLRAALSATMREQSIPGSRALAAAAAMSGDRDRAWTWYRAHGIREFGGLTAEQLVLEGREDDLLRYIDTLSAGSAG